MIVKYKDTDGTHTIYRVDNVIHKGNNITEISTIDSLATIMIPTDKIITIKLGGFYDGNNNARPDRCD